MTPGTTFAYPDGKGGVTEKNIPFGAMLSLATDKEDTLKAVQLTYLNGKGKRGRTQDGTKLPKLTFGAPKGAFVALSLEKAESRSDTVFLAEGVETALSIKDAGAPRVVASLGITNLKNFETEAKRVVLCADWDGSPTLPKALHTAQAHFQEKGQQGDILLPVTSSAQKKDFNDLLLEGGLKKVQDCVTPFLEEKDRDPNPFKAIPSLSEPKAKKEISLSEIAQESKTSGPATQPANQKETTTTPVEKAAPQETLSPQDEYLLSYIQEVQGSYLRLKHQDSPEKALPAFEDHLKNLYQKAAHQAPEIINRLSSTKDPETRDLLKTHLPEALLKKKSPDLERLFEEKNQDQVFNTFRAAYEQAQHFQKTSPNSWDHIKAKETLRNAGVPLMDCPHGRQKLNQHHPHAYVHLIQEHGDSALKQEVFDAMFERARTDSSSAPTEVFQTLQEAQHHLAQLDPKTACPYDLSKARSALDTAEKKASRCPHTLAQVSQKDTQTFEKLTQRRQQDLQREQERGRGFELGL